MSLTWLSPPVFIFTDRSKAMLLLWIILLFHVCLCYAVLSVPCSIVITCWDRADLLALLCVVFLVFLSFSHAVFWVRCGTWLYWFLIFAFLILWKVEEKNRRIIFTSFFSAPGKCCGEFNERCCTSTSSGTPWCEYKTGLEARKPCLQGLQTT